MAGRIITPGKGYGNIAKQYFALRSHPLVDGAGRNLPDCYKRFYNELNEEPSPVHYIPEEGRYKIDMKTGITQPVQNTPIPLVYPKAFHKGLWGGCAIVKGFRMRKQYQGLDPYFWVPKLKLSVVYSEVLDKYLKVVVTDRTIQLIHEHYGLDHYLLQTRACDLKADLALKLKRKILLVLDDNKLPHDDIKRRIEVYELYKHYLEKFDSEYIQWYGLSIEEAIMKMEHEKQAAEKTVPLKIELRREYLEELKAESQHLDEGRPENSKLGSLFNKINPFKPKT